VDFGKNEDKVKIKTLSDQAGAVKWPSYDKQETLGDN